MNKPFSPPPEPTFRVSPHNIEAEQALLGAILINNEAFYRVSEFLEPKHFFEPIHQHLFELIGDLVHAGKLATTVTLKTLLLSDLDIGGLSVNQYLARLASEATTIINAEDYGQTVHDLSMRPDLIAIGEDMINIAYDAPIEATPLSHIENAEQSLYKLAAREKSTSTTRSQIQVVEAALNKAARAYQRPGGLPDSPPVSPISMTWWGVFNPPILSSSPVGRAWVRRHSLPASLATSQVLSPCTSSRWKVGRTTRYTDARRTRRSTFQRNSEGEF